MGVITSLLHSNVSFTEVQWLTSLPVASVSRSSCSSIYTLPYTTLQITVLPHLDIHSSLWQLISKIGIVADLTDSITAALLYGTVQQSDKTTDSAPT